MNFIKYTFLNVVEICMKLRNHLILSYLFTVWEGKDIEVVMASSKIK